MNVYVIGKALKDMRMYGLRLYDAETQKIFTERLMKLDKLLADSEYKVHGLEYKWETAVSTNTSGFSRLASVDDELGYIRGDVYTLICELPGEKYKLVDYAGKEVVVDKKSLVVLITELGVSNLKLNGDELIYTDVAEVMPRDEAAFKKANAAPNRLMKVFAAQDYDVDDKGIARLHDTSGILKNKTLVFSNGVKEIGFKGFMGCDVEEVRITNPEMTTIREWAFAKCASLKTVTLNMGLRNIDNFAFCASGIQELELPPTIKYLGTDICRDCKQLKIVRIPQHLKPLVRFNTFGCKCKIILIRG